jgi:hypothetical protein
MDRFLDWLDGTALLSLRHAIPWAAITGVLALTCAIGIVRVARRYGDFTPRGAAAPK